MSEDRAVTGAPQDTGFCCYHLSCFSLSSVLLTNHHHHHMHQMISPFLIYFPLWNGLIHGERVEPEEKLRYYSVLSSTGSRQTIWLEQCGILATFLYLFPFESPVIFSASSTLSSPHTQEEYHHLLAPQEFSIVYPRCNPAYVPWVYVSFLSSFYARWSLCMEYPISPRLSPFPISSVNSFFKKKKTKEKTKQNSICVSWHGLACQNSLLCFHILTWSFFMLL